MSACEMALGVGVCRDTPVPSISWPPVIVVREEARRWFLAPGWWVAIATIALVLATGALGYFTFQLWKETTKAVKDAAAGIAAAEEAAKAANRQAEVAERALTGLERPYVLVARLWALNTVNPADGSKLLYFIFEVENFGRSPAILEEVIFKVFSGDPAEFPDPPNYLKANMIPADRVMMPGQKPLLFEMRNEAIPGDGLTITGQNHVIVYGFIKYRDGFGYIYFRWAAYRYISPQRIITLPEGALNQEKRFEPPKR